jgi:hypothetical protein
VVPYKDQDELILEFWQVPKALNFLSEIAAPSSTTRSRRRATDPSRGAGQPSWCYNEGSEVGSATPSGPSGWSQRARGAWLAYAIGICYKRVFYRLQDWRQTYIRVIPSPAEPRGLRFSQP